MKKTVLFLILILGVVLAGCAKKKNTTEQQTPEVETMATESYENEQIEQELVQAEGMTIVKKMVKLETSMGDIVIELNEEKAPITVENFLKYVNDEFYDGTIFHRVMKGFMVQGGGFTDDLIDKDTRPTIKNEASNGLKNLRGTIAMARKNDPHSATCQFFINHVDNNVLNYIEGLKPGYTVFGKVVEGMDVVDAIANVKVVTKMGIMHEQGREIKMKMQNVPAEPVYIKSATVILK